MVKNYIKPSVVYLSTFLKQRVELSVLPVVIGAICGGGIFMAYWNGYGSYVRTGLLPIILFVIAIMIVVTLLSWVIRIIWTRLFWDVLTEKWHKFIRDEITVSIILLFFLFAGWISGEQARNIYCRNICAKCDPIIEALKIYRSQYSAYPTTIQLIPNFQKLITDAGITVQDGHIYKNGLDVADTEEADAMFYLTPESYFCIVPLERKLPFSISRFYIYRKGSEEEEWKEDYMIWLLQVKK